MTVEKNFQQRIACSLVKNFDFSGLLQDLNQQQFDQFLQFLAEKNHIEFLNLSNNDLSDEQFLNIFDIVSANCALKTLDIRKNNITDYAIQKFVSKLLLQNMISTQCATQLQTIKLMGNPISQLAMRHLSGVTWIRKELHIYVFDAYLPYCIVDKNKTREVFSDGIAFLDSESAYQKAKSIEPHRDIFLMKVEVPAHAIEFDCEKNVLSQTSFVISQQFKSDLIIASEIDMVASQSMMKPKIEHDDFSKHFILKKQNYRIAMEYLFRSVKHLEDILENQLNQLDITQDGKQYLLIHFLLGKNNGEQDILNLYLIRIKISKLKQKQIFKEDILEISQHLFEISNYLKKNMSDVDFLLKEFHDFIENILDNLFVRSDMDSQKQKQLKIGVFAR